MDTLVERIEAAKNDSLEMDRLISEYMPFIKKAAGDVGGLGIEYDDRLSLSLLTFLNCVKQYKAERGSFIAFAAACIRNRLIDESRKQTSYTKKVLPLFPEEDDITTTSAEDQASIDAYSRKLEQESLSDEIDAFSDRLMEYGISFKDLPRICPKQSGTRKRCVELGRFVAGSEDMRENLFRRRRLAQTELAREFGLSEKTIEKHRRYIVAIVLLLTGDYPLIRAFLPQYKEV